MALRSPRVVVFDIGNVLIQWDPRHVYRDLFEGDEILMEDFLATVCTPEWNLEQDRGRPWDEAARLLTAQFPDCAELIRAYRERWEEMVPGPVEGTPEILEDLKARGVPLYAITNFAADTFALTRRRFPFLESFLGVVVSAEVGLAKPDAAIYRHFLEAHGVDPAEAVFIDDSAANVAAAEAVGMAAIRFTGADALRDALADMGLLDRGLLDRGLLD